jgi:hypothetical protein
MSNTKANIIRPTKTKSISTNTPHAHHKSKLSSTPFEGFYFIQSNMYKSLYCHLWRCLSTLQTNDYCTRGYMNQLIGQQSMILNSQDRCKMMPLIWVGESSQCVPIMFPLSSHKVFNVFPNMFSTARHFYPIYFSKMLSSFSPI